jgi:integrase
LPQGLCEDLRQHLRHVKLLHEDDLARGFGSVLLPYALKLKYPDVDKEFAWTYVFPSAKLSPTREDGVVRRHHTAESTPQQAVKRAIEKLRIYKHANCHTFRHSFARHLPENHYDIGAAQKLPCHKDVWTTQIYTHVLKNKNFFLIHPIDNRSRFKSNEQSNQGIHQTSLPAFQCGGVGRCC